MLNERPLRIITLTDELNNIIRGCIQGGRSDQEKLYRMFSSKMFGVCLRYCKDYEEAKDVLQDGFIKVFEKISQFGQRGSFEGWVRKIMVNTALEKYRKRILTVGIEQAPEIREEAVDEDGNCEFSMKELLGYVQSLPERYRLVFNLYVFEEMTHKEIGETMGITEGTSKSDLSRARSILQKQVNSRIKQVAKIG